MKYSLALFCLPALLAANAPAPLVTGAVRDQLGMPVVGAIVSAGTQRTATDADGTFALQGSARIVRISCAYCESIELPVAPDGTVAAVIRRYAALAQHAPTSADMQALPYAHAESSMSLTPFVVLNESARALPGPRLSYYGASRFGGLLVDDGIPAYDIAAGISAFRELPAYGVLDAEDRGDAYAFRYGDLAGGGTFFTQTQRDGGYAASAIAGMQRALQFASGSYALSDSADGLDQRERAGASAQESGADALFQAQAFVSQDRLATEYQGSARSSIAAVRLHFESLRQMRSYFDVIADRAGYTAISGSLPFEGQWSDVDLQAGTGSTGATSAFADAGLRLSTGFYDATAAGAPRVAGTVTQMHVDAGLQARNGPVLWRAGIGAFDVTYDGGRSGVAMPMFAQILVPSLSIEDDVAPHWHVGAEANASFRLPALAETYAFAPPRNDLAFDRYGSQRATLTYTDLHRLRLDITAMHRNVAGLDSGPVSAAGGSLQWQISQYVALRAWTLHVDDTSQPQERVLRFGAPPLAATPASLWATYANPSGVRLDAVWRRDLLDARPDPHFDASLSAPIAGAVRWFAATERRAGIRYYSIGLRYSQL